MNPEETYISPAVITSRAATKDMADIQAQHSNIVNGMSAQAARVATYNQSREAEQAAQNAAKLQADRQMRQEQTLSEQNKLELNLRQQELALKERSLGTS